MSNVPYPRAVNGSVGSYGKGPNHPRQQLQEKPKLGKS